MQIRPIVWGAIWFITSTVLWIALSVIGGTIEGLTGQRVQLLYGLVIFFGLNVVFSLPIATMLEIANWVKKRKIKGENHAEK